MAGGSFYLNDDAISFLHRNSDAYVNMNVS